MTIQLEVASNAERAMTGYAGALSYTMRYNTYRIEIMATGAIRNATRNGDIVPFNQWPPSIVKRIARAAANYFPVQACP